MKQTVKSWNLGGVERGARKVDIAVARGQQPGKGGTVSAVAGVWIQYKLCFK